MARGKGAVNLEGDNVRVASHALEDHMHLGTDIGWEGCKAVEEHYLPFFARCDCEDCEVVIVRIN